MSDPNEAVSFIVSNTEAALDKVAPFKPMTFQPEEEEVNHSELDWEF